MFNKFPYTNFHNLNLDWIVKTIKILFNKAVFSINNVEPDEDGNVTISGAELGAIGTINNIAPVDGNVTLNASDVGAVPSSIDFVETVNGISPDADGNVDVGTVKSVNNSFPDSNGNINLPTVAGVTSVDGVGPDANGNVQLGNLYVQTINNETPTNGNITLDANDVGALPDTINPVQTVNNSAADSDGNIQISATQTPALRSTFTTHQNISASYIRGVQTGYIVTAIINITVDTQIPQADIVISDWYSSYSNVGYTLFLEKDDGTAFVSVRMSGNTLVANSVIPVGQWIGSVAFTAQLTNNNNISILVS